MDSEQCAKLLEWLHGKSTNDIKQFIEISLTVLESRGHSLEKEKRSASSIDDWLSKRTIDELKYIANFAGRKFVARKIEENKKNKKRK